MSNLPNATQAVMIKLRYSDGVETIVPNLEYHYLKKVIEKAKISMAEEEIEDEDEEICSFPLGIVWFIDAAISDDSFQIMIPEDTVLDVETIEIELPYDLGENESEEDVRKFYSNYHYPKQNKIN